MLFRWWRMPVGGEFDSAFGSVVAGIKGEAVDDAEGGRLGVEGSGWRGGGAPILVLEVGLDAPVRG